MGRFAGRFSGRFKGRFSHVSLGSLASQALAAETQGLAIDLTDNYFYQSTGRYGSAKVKDTGTPANNFDSIPGDLLTYTGTTKLTRQSDGVYRYGPHNLYVNSATPANQSITVVSGASYSVTITGSVSVTASGAATGTWTAGTTTFTAATATLTLGSTSGSGTVHIRRTPSDSTYLPTTSAARYGLPFEWDSSGVLQGILVEPQATNLLTYSTQFDNAGWTKNNLTVTGNAATAPDDTLTADLLSPSTSAGIVYKSYSHPGGATSYIFSVWLKSVSGASFNVPLYTNGAGVNPNPTQTVAAVNGQWQRFTLALTGATGAGTINCAIGNLSSWAVGNDVYAWGAQLETGSVATSTIITYAASATRAADNISLATSIFPYNQASGTLNVQFLSSAAAMNAGGRIASLSAAGGSSRVIDYYTTSSTVAAIYNGSIQMTAAATAGVSNKLSSAYATADYALVSNGGSVSTDSSVTVNTATALYIGEFGTGTLQVNGYIQKLSYRPRRVSNADMQTETT